MDRNSSGKLKIWVSDKNGTPYFCSLSEKKPPAVPVE
jgi:hypothetical protein